MTRNPYADYMCFQRAERFSLGELRSYMERLFEADCASNRAVINRASCSRN